MPRVKDCIVFFAPPGSQQYTILVAAVCVIGVRLDVWTDVIEDLDLEPCCALRSAVVSVRTGLCGLQTIIRFAAVPSVLLLFPSQGCT